MKKMISKSVLFAVATVGLMAGGALASPISFDFSGSYIMSDSDASGIMDTISFDNADMSWPTPGSGFITSFLPTDDGLFGDIGAEYVVISDLTLDENNLFAFDPMEYTDGFQVYDDDDTLLFSATLTAVELEIFGSGADINSTFGFNLSEITAGGTYNSGDSEIVDSFINADPGAATTISLQFRGDLAAAIEGGGADIVASYSGSAAPIPEPATMLLFGTGLVSLAGFSRKKSKKA